MPPGSTPGLARGPKLHTSASPSRRVVWCICPHVSPQTVSPWELGPSCVIHSGIPNTWDRGWQSIGRRQMFANS